MKFANRTNWEQEPNALSRVIEQYRLDKIDFIDLTESNPTVCGFDYSAFNFSALSDPTVLAYQPQAQGLLSARQALSKIENFPTEQIYLSASTSESYSFLFRLLLNAGEKVLIPSPSYPLFQFLLGINDAEYETYPLKYSSGRWEIDLDVLESLIDPSTRAVVVVNPNNPTGSYITQAQAKALEQICARHHIALISDEVFYDYRLTDGDFVSFSGYDDCLTFVLGGLSKTLCLPQMKLGWIKASGPSDQLNEALERLEVIADTFLSVNTPIQVALPSLLEKRLNIQEQVKARVSTNFAYVKSIGAKLLTLEGGWYAVLVREGVDEEAFALNMLKEHRIFIHPGYFYDFPKEGFFVVSLLPRCEHFVKIKTIVERLYG